MQNYKFLLFTIFFCNSIIFICCSTTIFMDKYSQNHLSFQEEKSSQSNLKNYEFNYNNDSFVGRTFGGIRRLKLAIPAIMYKLGVVTTMLGFLTLLAIKSLIVGLIILVIQLSSGLSKFHSWKKDNGWENEHGKPPQNIHVHVHGGQHHGHHSYSHPPGIFDREMNLNPYSGWENSKQSSGVSSKIDDDFYLRLKEYKELKALRELRESLYQQVI